MLLKGIPFSHFSKKNRKSVDNNYSACFIAFNLAFDTACTEFSLSYIYKTMRKIKKTEQKYQQRELPNDNPYPRGGNSRTQEAVERIRQAILSGEFRPRERLIASELAEKLMVSRTPIREALQQLEVKGYVTTTRGGGLMVADRSPDELRQLFEIREALECKAIVFACERAAESDMENLEGYLKEMEEEIQAGNLQNFVELNSRFHNATYALTGNNRLASLIENYRDHFMDVRLVRTFRAEDWEKIMGDHRKIVEVIRERNVSIAQEVIRGHLASSLKNRIERL